MIWRWSDGTKWAERSLPLLVDVGSNPVFGKYFFRKLQQLSLTLSPPFFLDMLQRSKNVGPLWSSNGHLARLLLRQWEFESRRVCCSFYSVTLFEKDDNERKRGREWSINFFWKTSQKCSVKYFLAKNNFFGIIFLPHLFDDRKMLRVRKSNERTIERWHPSHLLLLLL